MSKRTHSDRISPPCRTDCDDTTIITLFNAKKKVPALARQHKKVGAAFAGAISFLVEFVAAMQHADIIAVTRMLVSHVENCRSESV